MSHALSNLKRNDLKAIIAVVLIIKGASLLANRHFFFWPPSLAQIMNDPFLDAAILICGIWLLIAVVLGSKSKSLILGLLIVSGFFCLLLAALLIIHAVGAGEVRMAHTAIGDLLLLALIWHEVIKH